MATHTPDEHTKPALSGARVGVDVNSDGKEDGYLLFGGVNATNVLQNFARVAPNVAAEHGIAHDHVDAEGPPAETTLADLVAHAAPSDSELFG